MEKIINLKESVYELTQKYPEIIDILASLGFTEISKKAVRHSVGKMMTIPRGASMKGIALKQIVKALQDNGFIVKDGNADDKPETSHMASQIKDYLQRLNKGEAMAAVRADFVKNFKDVKATEIMKAEQELIRDGEPVKKIKELCDIHSALFHGTQEGVSHDSLHQGLHHDQERMMIGQAGENRDKTTALRAVTGHPLQTLYRENEAIVGILDEVESLLNREANVADIAEALQKARGIAIHYAKKGDLIYPVLNVKYGIYGPSQVMWTIDDEIRAELVTLVKQASDGAMPGEEWRERVAAVAKRAREMTFKENRILFPVSAANFSDADWRQMYADSKGYEACLGVVSECWDEGEAFFDQIHQKETTESAALSEGRIQMPGGSLTVEQLTALLDALPVEITFVDADNINRYFNQPFTTKAFKRPLSALGREVFTCHPPKIEPMVRAIIQDFRDGKRDKVPVWLEKNGKSMLITYMTVRDATGKYIGTMEIVQDMEPMRAHFSGREK